MILRHVHLIRFTLHYVTSPVGFQDHKNMVRAFGISMISSLKAKIVCVGRICTPGWVKHVHKKGQVVRDIYICTHCGWTLARRAFVHGSFARSTLEEMQYVRSVICPWLVNVTPKWPQQTKIAFFCNCVLDLWEIRSIYRNYFSNWESGYMLFNDTKLAIKHVLQWRIV